MPSFPRRKPTRLKGCDYTQEGYYYVTICAYDRVCLFGDSIDGAMHLNSND